MEAIRLVIKQNKAHFRKPETITNKMTYPLPPFSTVIGALHSACDYTHYHPMDISVQGKYHAMQREIYVDHIRLNSTQDDRNILIKMRNPDKLSAGYQEVAVALKPQGNSFRKNITISISNQTLYDEYIALKNNEDELTKHHKQVNKPLIDQLNTKIKTLKSELKSLDKHNADHGLLKSQIDDMTQQKKQIEHEYKSKKAALAYQVSHYATLTKSIKSYEVLYDVELVVHVKADRQTLADIEANIYNLTAIGRSEDFIDLQEIKRVTLTDEIDRKYRNAQYMSYINKQLLDNHTIMMQGGTLKSDGIPARGTVYYIAKDYQIIDNKRVFNQIKTCLISDYIVNKRSSRKGVYVDNDGYIVNLN